LKRILGFGNIVTNILVAKMRAATTKVRKLADCVRQATLCCRLSQPGDRDDIGDGGTGTLGYLCSGGEMSR
jgi:hypothetical protein